MPTRRKRPGTFFNGKSSAGALRVTAEDIAAISRSEKLLFVAYRSRLSPDGPAALRIVRDELSANSGDRQLDRLARARQFSIAPTEFARLMLEQSVDFVRDAGGFYHRASPLGHRERVAQHRSRAFLER